MRRLSTLLPSLLFLLFSGCLEFDAQEITMRYDAEADRIDMLCVYRGLFVETGSGKTDDALKNAFSDLDEVMARGTAYFWCNWPLVCDFIKTDTPGAALATHVDVENGGLFTDPLGQLNGYQLIRIRDAKEFLKKLNTMLELAIQGALLTGYRGHKFDDDSKEFVREFLRSGEKMVTVEGGRIELRLPVSGADFKKLLALLEAHFLDHAPSEITRRIAVAKRRAGEDSSYSTTAGRDDVLLNETQLTEGLRKSASLRFFWDNDFTIDRSEEVQTVGLGVRGSKELRVVKASDGFYSDNFLIAVRERGEHKIEDGVPDQELRRRFEAFLKRDPVMPPELAAVRNR